MTSTSNELECTNVSRGVWLVKIPKYISQCLEQQDPMTEIGRLEITKNDKNDTEILFNLSNEIVKANASKSSMPMPVEHKMNISDVSQKMAIFSQDQNGSLALEGTVVQKGECRPVAGHKYMELKKKSIRDASQPTKTVMKLDRAVNNFKPINAHASVIENDAKKKGEGKKMRDDKDVVMNKLFTAFEKHQYYNIKHLEQITKQPVPYLKEILNEICHYNSKNPHRNMWELKPEFRHYKPSTESQP